MTKQNSAAELADMIRQASNTKPVAEFVTYIKQQLEISNNSWRSIAAAFAEASDMYGSDSDAYKQLLKATNFNKSKASKLVAIATSKRLKAYETQLRCVQSWSTLYEVTTLDDAQFAALCAEHDLDNVESPPVLTESMVSAFKRVKVAASPFKRIAYIEVDEDALRGMLLDGGDYETFSELLTQLGEISPYLKVVESEMYDAQTSIYFKEVETKLRSVELKKLTKAIERKLNSMSRKKHPNETKDQYFFTSLGISREELRAMVYEGDLRGALDYLGYGDEYDVSKLYDEALKQVEDARRKFKDKAIARANTAPLSTV